VVLTSHRLRRRAAALPEEAQLISRANPPYRRCPALRGTGARARSDKRARREIARVAEDADAEPRPRRKNWRSRRAGSKPSSPISPKA
jgi:hypothetical protein